MSRHDKHVKPQRHDERELDDAQLEAVTGGAGFLSGSLTNQQAAVASVSGEARANGILMRDSIIVNPYPR